MLKYTSVLAIFIFTLSGHAQTIIAKQSFESSGDSWKVTFSSPPCSSGGDIWNYQNNIEGIYPSDGDQFWGIRDLRGECGGEDFETIRLETIDISEFRKVTLTFDYNVFGFDSGDDIRYELIFDGISQGETILVDGNADYSTENWKTDTISVPNLIKQVGLIIFIKQNGQEDYAGIDNIKLMGDAVIPCSELMISEYIEGTSSVNHRNNYIEIYNPTNTDILLEDYHLTTYKGTNLIPVGAVQLSGTIAAYGNYLIEDEKETLGIEADISTNSTVMDFTGNSKIALRKREEIIDLIGHIGDSVDFAKDVTLRRKSHIRSPNDQYDENEWDTYGLEDISNLNVHVSNCSGAIPEIEIKGNSIEITDGSRTTSTIDNTYFENIDVNSGNSIVKEFTVKNTGSDTLHITDIYLTGSDAFTIIGQTYVFVLPDDQFHFEIKFTPGSPGIKTAEVQIDNNDASENPYNFLIRGEGTGYTNSPLIISQYYDGDGNNKWLEITNISESTTKNDQYYLALYRNEKAWSPIGKTPSVKLEIPALNPKQTLKIRSGLAEDFPSYAVDGTEMNSPVCGFNGNDILIISTTNDETCWENKIDIIGNSTNWGENISLVRKYGCEAVNPSTGFNFEDWIPYQIQEVDSAAAGYNYRIGEHYIGKTTFESGVWNNGLPGILRTAVINGDYNTIDHGNFETCNLEILVNKRLTIGTNNFVSIKNQLIVDGNLEIEHEGSLLMINDTKVINNGNIRVFKTTPRIKMYDYTYWSSPIEDAKFATEFSESPQSNIFKFNTAEFTDMNNDELDDDDPPAWEKESGEMLPGTGYAIMAPFTEPFKESQTVIFDGTLNNGQIQVPLQLSLKDDNNDNDWNLIGNPYPSAIDADLFLNDPVNQILLSGTIYFWTHYTPKTGDIYTSDDYASYVVNMGGIKANEDGEIPTGIIASCQGYFVEALQEGNIRFTNKMRVNSGNDLFFKKTISKENTIKKENKIWLNLYNEKGAFSQILIGFMENASERVERKFDAVRWNANEFISFYSIAEGKNLAIQGTKPIVEDLEIKLGFSSRVEERISLKIQIDKAEGEIDTQPVLLYDKSLNVLHDLQESDYEFTVDKPGKYNDRFVLKFQKSLLDVEDISDENDKMILKNLKDHFIISNRKQNTILSLEVYDIFGRNILKQKPNKSEINLDKRILHSHGIYILKMKLENGVRYTKKVMYNPLSK